MVPVSAPPRVRALLRDAPDGPVPVVHRGPLAAYLEVAGRCVGVVARGATAVPCALRADVSDLPGGSAHLSDGVLRLGDEPLVIGRIVDVRVPRLAASVVAAGPPWSAPITPITPATVPDLVGRGDGLTPLGDDLLCGWLALHRAAGIETTEVDVAVRDRLDRTTLLSATLLDCAIAGEVVPEFAAWIRSLGTAGEHAHEAALLDVGHTSGRGLLHGARIALADLDRHRSAA